MPGGRAPAPKSPPVCAILAEDPDLAAGLAPALHNAARRHCVAETVTAPPGRWNAIDAAEATRDGIGMLVLEGMIAAHLSIRGRPTAELLGQGDVIAPWWPAHSTLDFESSWTVLEKTRVARLDRRFARRAAPYPPVMTALTARMMRRARRLAIALAITHYPRIEDRVLLMLWDLAQNHGRVAPDGVHVPLGISHRLLAEMIAARRPSVTTALAQLARRGLVSAREPGWILHGSAPSHLRNMHGAGHSTTREAAGGHGTIITGRSGKG